MELLVSKYLCHDAKRGVEDETYTCPAFQDLVISHHLAVSQESREFHDVYSWVKTTDVSKEAKGYDPQFLLR